ncbi:MAG TPA: sigma-54 dependent transcriptional regulator [Polyangiaceae bacterium]
MTTRAATALIVSSQQAVSAGLEPLLATLGLTCRQLDEASALDELDSGTIEVVLVDVTSAVGLRLLPEIAREHAECAVIALTQANTTALGVQAVRAGAADFLCFPFDAEEVTYVLHKVQRGLAQGVDEPPPSMLVLPETPLIGGSAPMRALHALLQKAANGMATVLVRGESGSGKELVARQVHELSPRRQGPFIKVHCAALPDNLLESELFGYERGAFSGANARKPGRVEVAQGGTLFLDEIGDITPAIQVKLLRVLQDRQFERLGGNETLSADVRFVTATHRDLESMVRQGKFREDLFYRLNVVSLRVPALRERREDIEPLALHFCETLRQKNARARTTFDADALDLLRAEAWPGNVRELQNFIERLVVLADSPRISRSDVAAELAQRAQGQAERRAPKSVASLEASVELLASAVLGAEKRALEKALRKANGNRSTAARLLGISRRALYYKLAEHGLE